MSTLKTLLIALGIAAAANQIIPPLVSETASKDCDTVTECQQAETD